MKDTMTDTNSGVGREDWERRTTQRTGAGRVSDPYPKLAELRRQGPIHHGSTFDLLGVPDTLAEVWPEAAGFDSVGYAVPEQMLPEKTTLSNTDNRKKTKNGFGQVDPEGR